MRYLFAIIVLALLASCAPQARERYATLTPEQRVIEVQTRLSELRYDTGPIDGKMGPQTRRAIKEFQTTNGLSPDGHVSEALYTRLNSFGPRRGVGTAVSVDGTAHLEQFRGNWEGNLDCGQQYGKRQRANARVSMSLARVEGDSLAGRISWRGVSAYRSGNSQVRFSLNGAQRYPAIGELLADYKVNRLSRRWQTTSTTVGEISARRLSLRSDAINGVCALTLTRF